MLRRFLGPLLALLVLVAAAPEIHDTGPPTIEMAIAADLDIYTAPVVADIALNASIFETTAKDFNLAPIGAPDVVEVTSDRLRWSGSPNVEFYEKLKEPYHLRRSGRLVVI